MRWVLAALLLAAAPVRAASDCPFPGQAPRLMVQLYFGQAIAGGVGQISRADWQVFLSLSVAPALPDGFTVHEASGFAAARAGRTARVEPTRVVVAVADDTPAFRARVIALTEAYRRRFQQEAVGIVSTPVCAAF